MQRTKFLPCSVIKVIILGVHVLNFAAFLIWTIWKGGEQGVNNYIWWNLESVRWWRSYTNLVVFTLFHYVSGLTLLGCWNRVTSFIKFENSYFVYPGNSEVWAVCNAETLCRYFVVSSLYLPRLCLTLEIRTFVIVSRFCWLPTAIGIVILWPRCL